MKLLIKKLWFPNNIDSTINNLFRIPHMQELFDEDFVYDREMRPHGMIFYPRCWSADKIMDRIPLSDNDIYLVLTAMDLKGEYGSIHGKGHDRKALSSCYSYTNNRGVFLSDDHPDTKSFYAMTFHEIGHALGLLHHNLNQSDPCEMASMSNPSPRWESIEQVRFCDDCYKKLK
jgi:hypothetical protein